MELVAIVTAFGIVAVVGQVAVNKALAQNMTGDNMNITGNNMTAMGDNMTTGSISTYVQ